MISKGASDPPIYLLIQINPSTLRPANKSLDLLPLNPLLVRGGHLNLELGGPSLRLLVGFL